MNTIESITKGLQLSKSLFVSSIIVGEPYTGKLTLVRQVYPQSLYVDAHDLNTLKSALENHDEIIIYNFESIVNLDHYDFQNKRIIAIANKMGNKEAIEKHFAFIYELPPLRERLDEAKKIAETLRKEMENELMLEESIMIDFDALDLRQNFKSLKISLYKQLIKKSLTPTDIEEVLYDLFLEKLEGKNGYKDFLPLYERPLILAGLKKYKSQLQLSDVLGLNRNTLRKKIKEHNLD